MSQSVLASTGSDLDMHPPSIDSNTEFYPSLVDKLHTAPSQTDLTTIKDPFVRKDDESNLQYKVQIPFLQRRCRV